MIEIIPAIDVIEGKCVRLTKGDFQTKKTYSDDPLDVARRIEDAGIKRLHLVDLDGAREKRVINYKVLERIASKTGLWIDFGGGIASDHDLFIAFESGAHQVTGGSVAVKEPERFKAWLHEFGAEKIILGADVRDEKIAVSGWQETTELDIIEYLNGYKSKGVKYVICTDIAKDGMLEGPSMDLYKKIRDEVGDLSLIASGGVSDIRDVEALQREGFYGVIIGKALYEGRISLDELKMFL